MSCSEENREDTTSGDRTHGRRQGHGGERHDGQPITTALVPGMAFHRLWGGDAAPVFPDDGSPRPGEQYFPPVGGFRFLAFTVPPGASAAVTAPVADLGAAVAEFEANRRALLAAASRCQISRAAFVWRGRYLAATAGYSRAAADRPWWPTCASGRQRGPLGDGRVSVGCDAALATCRAL